MANNRLIVDFFSKEAPQIGINMQSLQTPQPDQLVQAYRFLCDLIFEDISITILEDQHIIGDRNTDQVMARPLLVLKTQQQVNMIFNNIFNGENEFCYTDLLQPDHRRTGHFVTQLIKFYYFKCDIAKNHQAYDSNIDEEVRAFDFEKTCEQKTNEQFQRDKEQLGQLEIRLDELGRTELQSKEQLADKTQAMEEEKRNNTLVQECFAEAQQTIESNKKKITHDEEIGKRLEMNIVNSPARIISELNQMEDELASARQKQDQSLQESRKLERELAEQRVTKQRIGCLSSELRKLEIVQDRLVESRGTEEKCKQEFCDLELKRRELKGALDQLVRQKEVALQGMQSELQNQRRTIESIREQKLHLENDEKELQRRKGKEKEDVRQHQQKIKQRGRDFLIVAEKYDDAVDKMLGNCAQLEKTVNEEKENQEKLARQVFSVFGYN